MSFKKETFLIKIVADQTSLFQFFKEKKEEYLKKLKNIYDLRFFLSDNFQQILETENERLNREFGLPDTEQGTIAEKILNKYLIQSLKNSTLYFYNFCKWFSIHIYTKQLENLLRNYPHLKQFLTEEIKNFVGPTSKKVKEFIHMTFENVSFIRTSHVLYINLIKELK